MANYPRFFVLADSTDEPQSGLQAERATNGRLSARQMWPADKRDFSVGHVLTSAQRAELEAFYATNRNLSVNFYWPPSGASHSVLFAAAPRYTPRGKHFEARVRLTEI